MKQRTLALAIAERADRTAVQLDELAHDREPQPQAAVCSRGGAVGLPNRSNTSLELLSLVLEMAGATVTGAPSATDALAEAGRARFDVVISHIGMPQLDGYGFMRQLRGQKLAGDIPAIALTAYARAEDAAQAFQAGFQEHVTKPVDAGALVATVARLLRR